MGVGNEKSLYIASQLRSCNVKVASNLPSTAKAVDGANGEWTMNHLITVIPMAINPRPKVRPALIFCALDIGNRLMQTNGRMKTVIPLSFPNPPSSIYMSLAHQLYVLITSDVK